MAGLCEGDNEPPGSLKASKLMSLALETPLEVVIIIIIIIIITIIIIIIIIITIIMSSTI
ncbi:hypothetical protein ANN_00447, partial [Periplaneta americana]